MCKHASKVSNGKKDDVSSIRWLAGMFCASIFTFTYIFAPIYIFSATLALLFRYPDIKIASVYALPLIISIFSSSKGMPGVVGMLSPMLDYFDYEAIVENKEALEENLDKGKNFIFACQPHGVISFCGMCSSVHGKYKYRGLKTAAASALLKFPILKNVMGIFALTDANGKNLKKILRKPGIDGSIVIYVGGIAELFKSSRKEERLFLSQRKGFIKLSLREGVDIIPVYLFGNTSILTVVSEMNFSIANYIISYHDSDIRYVCHFMQFMWQLKTGRLAKLSRKLQTSFTIFWGKYYLPIPRDERLLYVAGKAIEIPKISEPTLEDIDKYHKIYVQEVRRIFDTYKSRAGPVYENKNLFID